MKCLIALAIGLVSCGDGRSLYDALSACVDKGQEITVNGTVTGISFDNVNKSQQNLPHFELEAVRYYLLTDLNLENIPCTLGKTYEDPAKWGLGIKLLPDFFSDATLRPQNGDRVRVNGRFQSLIRNRRTFAILDNVTQLEIVTPSKDLATAKLIGEPCSSDMECDDHLICDRSSSRCSSTPFVIEFTSPWHPMNGACRTDEDCPLGQVCYLDYTIGETGLSAGQVVTEEERGQHICVLANDEAALCPRIGTSADLVGGRYITGKEVCIRGSVQLLAPPFLVYEDDSHVQLKVVAPFIYPETTDPYRSFGATTEIDPNYKDPILEKHTIGLPKIGDNITVLGTYRYDYPHGWFEVHPVKAWWPSE